MGGVLWFVTLKSGVHATLAGVALALTIPLRRSPGHTDDPASPLHVLEHALQPWVAFLIVPVFGFANAGVFLSVWGLAKLGLGNRPERASWAQVYGVSILAGIGFTMSLFIGLLAFANSPELQDTVKVGVLAGSLASAIVGALVLRFASPPPGRR